MSSLRSIIIRFKLQVARALAQDEECLLPVRAAAVAFLFLVLLMSCCRASSHRGYHALVIEPLQPEEAVVDVEQDAGEPLRRGIPLKPEPWQKKPPCDPDGGEEPINGACYVALKRKPPCGPKLLEDPRTSTCYRAVSQAPREPSSISPAPPH